MNETVQMIITLFGGLAIFIYGMNLMSDGLQQVAGEKLKSILAMLTRNPIVGVLAGAITTAVLQSSSATTVMVIGFVSAGLMNLPQAISIVLGANIGTTVTAQLVAFKIGDLAWAFVIVGFIMYFFIKNNERVNDIGQITFAFGLLFVGLNTMGDTMAPMASSPIFVDLMMRVQDIPALGILIGAIMTVVIQSSSATVAVLQNLASQAGPDGVTSIIGLDGALPILFGSNIGTTITALLAAIGASVNAKRTAVAHTVFNVVGTLIFVWFIPYIARLIEFLSPAGAEVDVISREIANAHLFFNVVNTIIFLPFIWVLVKLVTKIVPGNDQDVLDNEPMYLDEKLIESPVFAIHLATRELSRIAVFASSMIVDAKKAFLGNDSDAIKRVNETEETVNSLQEKTVSYLASIFSSDRLTEHQVTEISCLMHVAADIEHIGDYCTNIAEFAQDKIKHGYVFSDIACAEIYESFDQIMRMTKDAIECLETGNKDLARDVLQQEEEINRNEDRLRRQHMKRLAENKCSPEFTVLYSDIIHNIEKIGDCNNNIAEAVLKEADFKKLNEKQEEDV